MAAWKLRMERLKSMFDKINPSKVGCAHSMGAGLLHTHAFICTGRHTGLFHMLLIMYTMIYCARTINQPLLKYKRVSH